MTRADVLIEARDLALCYRLAKQRIPSIKEYAIHWMKGSLKYEKLWAVKGVSFELRRGESLGIVGRNGAGKSSLLKLISRVLKPTRGNIEVRGTIAPILELGTGFDTELTGMENIYLNALLLGRSRREIEVRVEEIVEFSGLSEFIHAPIRNYSTGMVARLGFAVATGWRPDILILDEVLSVGDVHFTQRCEERIQGYVEAGTTLLMVSHSAEAIRRSCEQAMWLEKGKVRGKGPAEEVIEIYEDFATK